MGLINIILISYVIYFPCICSSLLIEQFIHRDLSPKCCSLGKYLVNDSLASNYKCELAKEQWWQVLVSSDGAFESFLMNPTQEFSCVDLVKFNATDEIEAVKLWAGGSEEVGLDFFPKCCPVGATYDMFEHKCVKSGYNNYSNSIGAQLTSINQGGLHLKIGLSDCSYVIKDYEFWDLSEIVLTKNSSIKFDGIDAAISFQNYCIDDVLDRKSYIIRVCYEHFDICKTNINDEIKTTCIRKCCKDGYMYKGGPNCAFDFENGMNFPFEKNTTILLNPEEPFAIVQGHYCDKYHYTDEDYTIDQLGYLQIESVRYSPFETMYCFEEVQFGDILGQHLFLCFDGELDREKIEFRIKRVALPMSCVFLILTVIGYAFVPELQNVHGKILMSHCLAMLLAYFLLAILNYFPTWEGFYCLFLGYSTMYFSLSSFMWLNVMCFDIWRTFVSMTVQGRREKKKQLRQFLWYCCYAWSTPAVITTFALLTQLFGNFYLEVLQPIVPRLNESKCFFDRDTNMEAYALWFLCPISLIFLCNLILFVKTSVYCYKVKNDLEKMKDMHLTKNEYKQILSAYMIRLKTIGKLFVVMGVSWLSESVSGCVITPTVEGAIKITSLVFDTINSLQGVFIFGVFILNKNYLNTLRKRLGVKVARRPSQSTTSTTRLN